MDSFKDKNGRWHTACHECEYGGNGSLKFCNVGKNIKQNTMNRGCWGGVPVLKVKEALDAAEVREQKNNN